MQTSVVEGRTGLPLMDKVITSSAFVDIPGISLSLSGKGNDFFLYWVAVCVGHEEVQQRFSFLNSKFKFFKPSFYGWPWYCVWSSTTFWYQNTLKIACKYFKIPTRTRFEGRPLSLSKIKTKTTQQNANLKRYTNHLKQYASLEMALHSNKSYNVPWYWRFVIRMCAGVHGWGIVLVAALRHEGKVARVVTDSWHCNRSALDSDSCPSTKPNQKVTTFGKKPD